jgi:ribosomal-protein-serine acetyltransferase
MLRFELDDDCHLRLLEEADADELFALIDANRDSLRPWMPWAAGQDREGTGEFIRLTRRQLADTAGYTFAIVCGGRLAGVIGCEPVDWTHRCASIGYWLGEAYRGRGTMTRAARVLVDHAVSEWELNRVEIRAAVGNARSRAIPERLGFREEGTLRQAERVGETYLDSVVYSMLSSEWLTFRKS